MTTSPDAGSSSAAEVLVVSGNYNGGELVARAVEAMKRQTFTDYHLVVVDNASRDDSIASLRASHPETEVLPAGANLGFAAANNLALRRFSGSRWIALLNPDAFPEPDRRHHRARRSARGIPSSRRASYPALCIHCEFVSTARANRSAVDEQGLRPQTHEL